MLIFLVYNWKPDGGVKPLSKHRSSPSNSSVVIQSAARINAPPNAKIMCIVTSHSLWLLATSTACQNTHKKRKQKVSSLPTSKGFILWGQWTPTANYMDIWPQFVRDQKRGQGRCFDLRAVLHERSECHRTHQDSSSGDHDGCDCLVCSCADKTIEVTDQKSDGRRRRYSDPLAHVGTAPFHYQSKMLLWNLWAFDVSTSILFNLSSVVETWHPNYDCRKLSPMISQTRWTLRKKVMWIFFILAAIKSLFGLPRKPRR